MCLRNALVLGFEEQDRDDFLGIFSSANTQIETASPRANAQATRGGAGYLNCHTATSTGGVRTPIPRTTAVGWLECIIEGGISFNDISGNVVAFSMWGDLGSRLFSIAFDRSDGRVRIYRSGTNSTNTTQVLEGTQVAISSAGLFTAQDGDWVFFSVLVRYDPVASASVVDVRINQKSVTTYTASGLDLDPTAPATTVMQEHLIVGERKVYVDDLLIRPRAIRVDGVSGSATVGNTITGATNGATAIITGWESQSSDSSAGPGDPLLAANEYRLFLQTISFDPDPDTGDPIFDNNEQINNTGLTGTALCNAPHAGFKAGLEPGSMFIGPGLFIERVTAAADGTDTVDWSLGGGATDHADAVQDVPVNTAKYIESTTAGDRGSVTVTALANQSSISEVMAIAVHTHGVNDGVNPNAILPRLIDNATDIDDVAQVPGTSTTALKKFVVDSTAAGGQWAVGAGAGGTDAVELGVESATV